jgi:hypothetical protein
MMLEIDAAWCPLPTTRGCCEHGVDSAVHAGGITVSIILHGWEAIWLLPKPQPLRETTTNDDTTHHRTHTQEDTSNHSRAHKLARHGHHMHTLARSITRKQHTHARTEDNTHATNFTASHSAPKTNAQAAARTRARPGVHRHFQPDQAGAGHATPRHATKRIEVMAALARRSHQRRRPRRHRSRR